MNYIFNHQTLDTTKQSILVKGDARSAGRRTGIIQLVERRDLMNASLNPVHGKLPLQYVLLLFCGAP